MFSSLGQRHLRTNKKLLSNPLASSFRRAEPLGPVASPKANRPTNRVSRRAGPSLPEAGTLWRGGGGASGLRRAFRSPEPGARKDQARTGRAARRQDQSGPARGEGGRKGRRGGAGAAGPPSPSPSPPPPGPSELLTQGW
eukprot:bmy_20923T0